MRYGCDSLLLIGRGNGTITSLQVGRIYPLAGHTLFVAIYLGPRSRSVQVVHNEAVEHFARKASKTEAICFVDRGRQIRRI